MMQLEVDFQYFNIWRIVWIFFYLCFYPFFNYASFIFLPIFFFFLFTSLLYIFFFSTVLPISFCFAPSRTRPKHPYRGGCGVYIILMLKHTLLEEAAKCARCIQSWKQLVVECHYLDRDASSRKKYFAKCSKSVGSDGK